MVKNYMLSILTSVYIKYHIFGESDMQKEAYPMKHFRGERIGIQRANIFHSRFSGNGVRRVYPRCAGQSNIYPTKKSMDSSKSTARSFRFCHARLRQNNDIHARIARPPGSTANPGRGYRNCDMLLDDSETMRAQS